MKILYCKDITTHVPTCALVEDYQMLAAAIREQDWDAVATVMDCLAEVIESHTEVPSHLDVNPSPSSLVAMGHIQGIIVDDSGHDIRCALDRPVSEAMQGGVGQCPDNCPHREACEPDKGRPVLMDGHPDNEEELVTLLESRPDSEFSAEAKELVAYISSHEYRFVKYTMNEVIDWAKDYCKENCSSGTKVSDIFSNIDITQAVCLLNVEVE